MTLSKRNEIPREASQRVKEISAKAAEGLRDCQPTTIEAAPANVNAMFDYVQKGDLG